MVRMGEWSRDLQIVTRKLNEMGHLCETDGVLQCAMVGPISVDTESQNDGRF